MIPVPFTSAAVLLSLAFLISKIQYSSSHIIIALHATLGPLQTATLLFSLISYLQRDQPQFIYILLFLISLGIILVLNLLGFLVQTPLITTDSHFLKWMKRRDNKKEGRFNCCWFYSISIVSLLTNYKLKMVLFSGLFNFDCLKCKLQNVQKFKIFNVFAFLGLAPEIIILYCTIVLITSVPTSDTFFIVLLDTIIIFSLNILLSLFAAKKDPQFFGQQIDGVSINKVVNVGQQQFNSSYSIGGKNTTFGALDDVMQLDEYAYISTKRGPREVEKGKVADQKISECTEEENTVSDSHGRMNQDNISVVEGGQEPIRFSNSICDQPVQQANILMIDEVYDFQSDQNHKQEKVQFSELKQIQAQKRLQIPEKELTSRDSFQQEQRDSSIENQGIVQEQKSERVNLVEYLTSMEKQQNTLNFSNTSKYVRTIPQEQSKKLLTNISEELQINHQNDVRPKTQIKQSNTSQKDPSNFRRNRVHLKSEPVIVRIERQSKLDEFQNCTKLNKQIKRIVSGHNSPSKYIRQSPNKRSKQSSPGKLSMNQDHDQKPISNRSKQKLSITNNHPIRKQSPTHPLKSSRGAGSGEDYNHQDMIQNRRNNQHLRKRKNKTEENIRHSIDIIQDHKEVHTKTEETVIKVPEIKQISKQRINRQLLIDETIQESPKEFKRSQPHFVKRKIQTVSSTTIKPSQPDIIPLQPLAPSKSKSLPKRKAERIETEISMGSFVRMFAPSSLSADKKSPVRNQRKKRGSQLSLAKNDMKVEDRRRMNSLERIYLQKQTTLK